MKKLLSVALVATVALGSMNMQAGDGAKKAWAYTKIVSGVASLIGCVILPLAGIGSKRKAKKVDTLNQVSFALALVPEVIKDMEPAKVREIAVEGLVHSCKEHGSLRTEGNYLMASPIALLPLGILSIQSGKSDLKELKTNAQKKNAQKDKMLLV